MMMLWFLMLALCSAAVVAVSVPLIRRTGTEGTATQETAVYQDQLREVDNDLAAGTINAPEAAAAKVEIERRLLVAQQNAVPARPLSPTARMTALIAVAGFVIIGGVSLYATMGNPNMPSASSQQAAQTNAGDNGDASEAQVQALIAQLQTRLAANPKDSASWRLLGWALFNTGKFQEAVDAYGKAVALEPDNAEFKSLMAEAVVQAAQGVVTPQAQDLIAQVLAKTPDDLRARFYDAMAHEQSGDQQGALDRWSKLLADAPAEARWRDNVKARIADLGQALHKDVSGIVNTPPPAAAAPTADQQAMIEGMVQKLAGELKQNPQNAEGWVRLIRSYQVLKAPDKAKASLADGLAAFAGDPDSQAKIKTAAKELGVEP